MPTITAPGAPRCAPQATLPGRVQEDFTSALRQHGMECPIRGLADPRLEYPELLIIAGWDRVPLEDGYAYRMVVDQNPQTGDRWEQSYEVRDDQSTLVSRVGHREQILTESPQGRVTCRFQLVD